MQNIVYLENKNISIDKYCDNKIIKQNYTEKSINLQFSNETVKTNP